MLTVLEHLDHQLFFTLNNGMAAPWLDPLMRLVSILGDGVPLTIAVGIGLWWYDRRIFQRHYGWIVFAVLFSSLVAQVIKHAVDRPRPLAEFAPLLQAGEVHIHAIGRRLLHRSLPSGHVQSAVAVCTYLSSLYPRSAFQWIMGMILIGLSRIYLGVHFPADVIAGAAFGNVCTIGVLRFRLWWRA